MATYKETLHNAQERMIAKGQGEQAAQLLLLELANKEAHDLYMEFDEAIPADMEKTFETGIERMLQGEPLGHVLGFEWFYGYKFHVNEDVLIPRPETEELVANILANYDEYFAHQENVQVIDVGTGSGAIAIALKKEAPKLNVIGSDISEKAIKVANQNAAENKVMLPFCCGDMLQPFIERNLKVDILISNPPYIPQNETMEDSVVNFEPHVALFGGEDGLKFYRIIFENAPKILKEKAMLAFEIGYDQRESLSAEASKYFPNARIEVLKDMSGKDRMLFIYINLPE